MNPMEVLTNALNENACWEKNITLERNEYLTVNGNIDLNIYYVLNGSLRIFLIDEVEEHTIRFGYQDSIIAILDSFITGKPTSYYVQAIKKTELKVISKSNFLDFIGKHNELRENWYQLLEILIYQQMEREHDLLTSSPVERYKRVMKRSPRLFQEIPGKYIASYLRMTPETLSRIKKS